MAFPSIGGYPPIFSNPTFVSTNKNGIALPENKGIDNALNNASNNAFSARLERETNDVYNNRGEMVSSYVNENMKPEEKSLKDTGKPENNDSSNDLISGGNELQFNIGEKVEIYA